MSAEEARPQGSAGDSESRDTRLARTLDEYTERLRAGEVDLASKVQAEHPDLAKELFELLELAVDLHRDAPASLSSAPFPEPSRLGPYQLIREVGRGGMGIVYEAVQQPLGRIVAIKLLSLRGGRDERAKDRFLREARAAARLHHPNIIALHSAGEEGGVLYIAMEFVDGPSLDLLLLSLRSREDVSGSGRSMRGIIELLRNGEIGSGVNDIDQEGAGQDSPPPLEVVPEEAGMEAAAGLLGSAVYVRNVARICMQLADALAEAHSHGVLHRDVKPANVFLDPRGRPVLGDFGLCTLEDDADVTRSKDVIGTLRYMAPEQLDGNSDVRTDIYGLGVTLYELLTLSPAVRGTARRSILKELAAGGLRDPRRANRSVPAPLAAIVLKATAQIPAERYACAADLRNDLLAFLQHRPVSARPPSTISLLRLAVRRSPKASAALLAAALAMFALLGLHFQLLSIERALKDRQLYIASVTAANAALELDNPEVASDHLERAPIHERGWEWDHLRARMSSRRASWAIGDGRVRGVAVSPDGAWILASAGRTAALFRSDGSDSRVDHKSARGVGFSAVFSSSGDYAAVVTSGNELVRFRVREPLEDPLIVRFGQHLYGLAALPNDAGYLVGTESGEVLVLDQEGLRQRTLEGRHGGPVRALAIYNDGKLVASGAADGRLLVRSMDGGTIRELNIGGGGISDCIFAADGGSIFVASNRGRVVRWSFEEERILRSYAPGRGQVYDLDLMDAGNTLVAATKERFIVLWDVASGSTLAHLGPPRRQVNAIATSSGGRRVYAGTISGVVEEWDAAARGGLVTRRTHLSHARALAFSPRGDELASGDMHGRVVVQERRTGRVRATYVDAVASISDLAWSEDGRFLASAGNEGFVTLWDREAVHPPRRWAATDPPYSSEHGVAAVVFDSGRGRAYAAVRRAGVAVLGLPDLQQIERRLDLADDPRSLAIGNAMGLLAVGRRDGTIGLFELDGLRPHAELEGHSARVDALAFDLANERLASASDDGTVRIWDIKTAQTSRILTPIAEGGRHLSSDVVGLDFRETSDRLVVSTRAGAPQIFDPNTGERVLVLSGITYEGSQAAWDPSGETLACVNLRGVLHLYDTIAGVDRTPACDTEAREQARPADMLNAEEWAERLAPGPRGSADRLDPRDAGTPGTTSLDTKAQAILGLRGVLAELAQVTTRGPEDHADRRRAITLGFGMNYTMGDEAEARFGYARALLFSGTSAHLRRAAIRFRSLAEAKDKGTPSWIRPAARLGALVSLCRQGELGQAQRLADSYRGQLDWKRSPPPTAVECADIERLQREADAALAL